MSLLKTGVVVRLPRREPLVSRRLGTGQSTPVPAYRTAEPGGIPTACTTTRAADRRRLAQGLQQRPHVLRLWPGPTRIAHQMDDEIAAADVVRQLLQQREASLLKILLDLDLERPSLGRHQVISQLQPVRLELSCSRTRGTLS